MMRPSLCHLVARRAWPLRRYSFAVLALCGAVALSACAPSGASHASVTATPQPTAIVATPGNAAVCAAVSAADFARVDGHAATQVTTGVTPDGLTGLREVFCLYLDTTDPQQTFARGTINVEIASDAQSAGRIYQLVRQSFTNVADVPGVGDAAFSGTPGGAGSGAGAGTGAGTGLVVRRGAMLLYLSVGGDASSRLRITRQLALLVLARVTTASG